MIHTKPEIIFSPFPFINLWIEAQYKAVDTKAHLIDFIHKCIKESESTKNEVRAEAYRRVGYTLYSIVTGKSYESILNINS